ncbi:MAG TPA: UbiX family flavin prenyltransferase, partial [Thermoanaerobaculia bacterium]|nr:UbiX family flavin prenyltransferase [Thermoanaerobaculia bacterium]
MKGREVVVGVSGASGAQLARRFVELAVTAPELSRLHLIFSDPALRVAQKEIDPSIEKPSDWLASLSGARRAKATIVLHDNRDVGASIASGSYATSGMVVIPCSGGTLGAIANGISRDLVGRAADVMLKERRPLLLAFRESPYSLVAIENMRRATLAGAVLIPPTPAFYIAAASMERFLDAYCIRAGRWLGLSIPGEDYGWKGD